MKRPRRARRQPALPALPAQRPSRRHARAVAAWLLAAFAGGAWAGDAAPVPGGAGESASQAVAPWMVGRFIGTNDGYEGHIAELQISHSGHVIAVIDGREALTGQIRDDRLFVETFEFIVTRTDEGLRTQQVGDDGNVVYYTRM